MNLNLGCGDRYAEGWVNVDHSGMPHRKDVTLDLRCELPWEQESVDRIYMGHVLEHLHVHEVISLLNRIRMCLRLKGQLMVVGPDVNYARGLELGGYVLEVPLDQLRWGADRWGGDVHRWECSKEAIAALLHVTGWRNVQPLFIEDVPPEWPVAVRGPKWQCGVSATR